MNRYNLKRKQKGIALIELGMFLPIYILILTMVVDLGRQFARYTQLSAICYEGLRQLTQERQLEIGRFNESEASNKPIHYSVQNKIRYLVELNRSKIPKAVTIVTERTEKNVSIELTTGYKPLLPFYGGMVTIKTAMVGPYLFS